MANRRGLSRAGRDSEPVDFVTANFGVPPKKPVVFPTAVPGTWHGDLVRAELRTIWAIRRALEGNAAGAFLRQFISQNPYRDISLLTWTVALVGMYEHGLKMFYVTIVNLFFSAALRPFVRARRPFEYDLNLRPWADRQPTAYGLPSIESWMAVVVFGYMFYKAGGGRPEAHLGTAAVALFIGLTRIYAGSRFIHQVVLSWAGGAAGLASVLWAVQSLPPWHLSHEKQSIVLMGFGVVFLAYIALAIEDNSSTTGLGISNREFVRVLTDIIDTSEISAAAVDPRDLPDADEPVTGGRGRGAVRGRPGARDESPQMARFEYEGLPTGESDGLLRPLEEDAAAQRRARTQARRQQRAAERRDSFYFLQHTMRRRSAERGTAL